jgi:flagellar biosynthesis/type III secretory pathway protein FliH
MAAHLPVDFNPRQVSLFLEKIALDCDTELHDIAERRDAEIARIRGDAYAESRRLFRHSAEQLRTRLALERNRYLARVRSDLRRQQWEILVESQQHVLKAVSDRFWKAWEDPDRQWEWSRYWLEMARDLAGDNAIQITLGKGALESVRAKIEKTIRGYHTDTSVIIDPETDPGICIEWGDCMMDGRLSSQTAEITDAVLSRLSDLLYEQAGESS